MAFTWADYLVCFTMLAVSSAVGIYYRFTGGRQKTTREFLLANGNANMFMVSCSLMATFMSSISLLGVSSEIYTYGTQFVTINLSYGMFTPITAHLYLPVFYKLKAVSVYEYLERRFGMATRVMASVAFSVQMILYMGIVVYAPALALEAVTGIKHIYAIFIIGGVCTFYAGLGGMKAVLFTDMFQAVLMLSAVLSVVISALIETGFTKIWSIASEHQRIEFSNFSPDPTVRHTWWSTLMGGGFTFTSLYAVNQAQVQRYLSLKDLKTAQISLYMNFPILVLLSLSTSFAGLCIFSKYYECDPLLTKRITSADQLMPRYVLDTMSHAPGVSGLFVAGIFSGSLSTMSSALNSLSAVTVEDYIKPAVKFIKQRDLEDSTASICTKFLCLVYGLCCLAVAFMSEYMGAVLQASLTIFGIVGGPILSVYTLGMFIPFGNEIGALTSLVLGLCLGFWIGFGGPKPPLPALPKWSSAEGCKNFDDIHVDKYKNFSSPTPNPSDYMYMYSISYQWYIVVSFIVSFCVGIFVSWVAIKLKYTKEIYAPELMIHPIAKYLEKRKKKKEDASLGEAAEMSPTGTHISLTKTSSQKDDSEDVVAPGKDKV